MTTVHDEQTQPDTTTNDDQGDVHLYCCNPDIAYCGTDISTETDIPDVSDDQVCPLCLLATDWPCPDCGGARWRPR